MHEGETEPIPRVADRDESDMPDISRERESGRGHGHHDHRPPPPASRRVRTLVAALLVPFALAAVVGTVLLFPFGDGPQVDGGAGRPVNGVVTAAESGACNGGVQVGEQQGGPECLLVTVRMTDGEAPGEEVRTVVPLEPSTPRFAVDDEVVLSYGGSDPRDGGSYQLVDFQRDMPLALLAGLFAVAVLVLGRWQGLKALIALGLSFLVLVFFVLPAIIAGESPLLVAICGAGVIMFAVLYLTHGLSARTSTAVLGTMVSLAMIGVLGALWAAFAKLTGLDEETSTLVGLLNAPIDTRGLLLAGVVIGALGVLDDVTVTQTSAVWELRAANPLLTRRELYASALRIGRDHVASAVNTLVMAYAGAALPLLLYSSISGVGLGSILTSQSIAQELVRTLVGSIGLVAAVPITTALAAAVASQEPAPDLDVTRPSRERAGKRPADRPAEERPTRERTEPDDSRATGTRTTRTPRRTRGESREHGEGAALRSRRDRHEDEGDRRAWGGDESSNGPVGGRGGNGTPRTAVTPRVSTGRRSAGWVPGDGYAGADERPARRRDDGEDANDRGRAAFETEGPANGRAGGRGGPDAEFAGEWTPSGPAWPVAEPGAAARGRRLDAEDEGEGEDSRGWPSGETSWPGDGAVEGTRQASTHYEVPGGHASPAVWAGDHPAPGPYRDPHLHSASSRGWPPEEAAWPREQDDSAEAAGRGTGDNAEGPMSGLAPQDLEGSAAPRRRRRAAAEPVGGEALWPTEPAEPDEQVEPQGRRALRRRGSDDSSAGRRPGRQGWDADHGGQAAPEPGGRHAQSTWFHSDGER
ncbi:YibE/F family protein [Actinophytocola xanthii]|uniref:YibE/F family protein n=1 Tax=Actinophytocola xanthii TaxID=1912961 RepID=UPI0026A5BAC4